MTSRLRRPRSVPSSVAPLAALVLGAAPSLAQQPTVEERLQRLEQENRELRTRLDGVEADTARHVDGEESPVSFGGYGEFMFTQLSGATDESDALRGVIYLGYRFDENWSLSTEIEIEHASTGANGEVSLEMASLDYRASDDMELRGGLLLVPMGIINERHEPTTFLPNQRPETERRIIPTTWREIGAGMRGSCGDTEYALYGVTGFDGENFDSSGLRGGRQKGSEAAADDWAGVLAVRTPLATGLSVGGSIYYGNSGQDGLQGTTPIPSLGTTIAEFHGEWESGPCSVRALYASAWIDGAGTFSNATGTPLAHRMEGYYVEVGVDALGALGCESRSRLTPFLRFEHIDTQADMPSGIVGDPTQDNVIYTFGINFKPIDNVVIKVDYADWDNDSDRFTIGMGYAF